MGCSSSSKLYFLFFCIVSIKGLPEYSNSRIKSKIVLNFCIKSNTRLTESSLNSKLPNSDQIDRNQEAVSIPAWWQSDLSPEKREYLMSKTDLYPIGLFNFSIVYQSPKCPSITQMFSLEFYKLNNTDYDQGLDFGGNSTFDGNSTLEGNSTYDEYTDSNGPIAYNSATEHFTPDGYFFSDPYTFCPDRYCISKINSEELKIEACFPEISNDDSNHPGKVKTAIETEDLPTKTNPNPKAKIAGSGKPQPKNKNSIKTPVVLPKCCSPGSTIQIHTAYLEYGPYCAENPNAHEWSPTFFREQDSTETTAQPIEYTFKRMDIKSFCKNLDFLTPFRGALTPNIAELRFLENGTVLVRRTGNHGWDRPKVHRTNYIDQYCVDGLLDSALWPSNPPNFSSPIPQMYSMIAFCHGESQEEYVVTYSTVYFAIYFPSALLLLIVVIVYGLVWRMQNIHGWTVAGFSFAMLMWFGLSALAEFAGIFEYDKIGIPANENGCITIAVLHHFFYIATYCWMTILNFDLWSTISSMTAKSSRGRGVKRFMVYCFIGFGVPTVVVIISLIIEKQYSLFDTGIMRPQYGLESCGLAKTSTPYYAILPNFILFILNTIFAGLTMRFLWDYKRTTKCLDKSSTTTRKQDALLFGKLFTLMGFTWLFELIPNLLEKDDVTWYWAAFHVYNILQAFGLFYIFVLKKEIRDQLMQNYKVFESGFNYLDVKLKRMKSERTTAVSNYSSTTHSESHQP